MNTVSIRLEEIQDKDVEEFARKMKIEKSAAVRKILEKGLKVLKTKEALENVRLKRWTIWRAAGYCGESYQSFLTHLHQENIPFPLSVEDLETELNENRSE